MGFIRKHLGQARPADTNNVSIVSGESGKTIVIQHIFICNTSASAATYRVFFDNAGTTYNKSTSIFYDVSLASGAFVTHSLLRSTDSGLYLVGGSGNLAVRTSVLSALTFTINGGEIVRGKKI